jgi:hypothetical protein
MNQKHISGFSGVYQSTLYVIFNYNSDFGFDPLSNVQDVTYQGVAPSTTTYSTNKVILTYLNYNSPVGGYKTYQITFESGYTTTINVDVLGTNRAIANFADGHTGLAGDCSVGLNYIQSAAGRTFNNQINTYAAYAESDPGNVFNYPNLWERPHTYEIFDFNGDYIRTVWATNGYAGGKAQSNVTGLQHLRLITAVNQTIADLNSLNVTNNIALFIDAIYNVNTAYPAVAAFDWTLDLNIRGCKVPLNREYNVCKDPADPGYFETTGVDCDSVAIPADILNGGTNAIFNDGCGCSTGCLDVDAFITLTPASSTTANDGTFTITVSGGTANYTYLLTVPSGITYGGTPNPPATSSTSYTFTDIPGTPNTASGLYTLSVNDSTGAASGCTKEYKLYMPIEESRYNVVEGCTDSHALNYNASATEDNGSCVLCDPNNKGGLTVGGNVIGPFVTSGTSFVTDASTSVATDGSIQFSGQINPLVDPFIPEDFDITLHTATGNGGGISAAIDTVTGATTPATNFIGLASGWYAVKVVPGSESSGCQALIYFYVGYTESEVPCDAFVDLNIDPCTGSMTISVNTPPGVSIVSGTYGLREIQYNLYDPAIVYPGDTVYISIQLDGGEVICENFTTSIDVTEADLNCEEEPTPQIPGCTDPNAQNYNPSATVNDGSCIQPVLGCTDPEAVNFDPTAQINDGSCIYGIVGCTDPQATNYDPNATIDDGSCFNACSERIVRGVTLSGNEFTVVFVNITTSYSITWVNNETGESITTEDTATSPPLEDGVYTITVTDGNGCTETVVRGINTTIVYGCMDIYADNYNPAANVSDNSCEYTFGQSPCIPGETDAIQTELDKCVSGKLNMFYNLMKAGRITPCKTKESIVLKLIRYIISQKGLECVYNCADSLSPTYSETPQGEDCSTKWNEGGPSGEALVWSSTATYVWGDVVQHPVSGDIYTMTLNPNIGSYVVGSDPETQAGQQYWEYCKEPFNFADTTNRLDSYIAYIRKECKDCNIPGYTPLNINPEPNPVVPDPATEEGTSLHIEGEELDL